MENYELTPEEEQESLCYKYDEQIQALKKMIADIKKKRNEVQVNKQPFVGLMM